MHKSKTLHRDLNPVWDECFTVPIEDPFVPITIKVILFERLRKEFYFTVDDCVVVESLIPVLY